jgi:hypothetical protein
LNLRIRIDWYSRDAVISLSLGRYLNAPPVRGFGGSGSDQSSVVQARAGLNGSIAKQGCALACEFVRLRGPTWRMLDSSSSPSGEKRDNRWVWRSIREVAVW